MLILSISRDNPISWFVPLQLLAVSLVFFEHEDVVFARMSVVVVNAVVSLSASSFACRCSLVSAFKRACRRFLAACSGLSLWRSFWDVLPGILISVSPIFCMHHCVCCLCELFVF